jgi:diguanylate cyclase (GGDEF)-like protein
MLAVAITYFYASTLIMRGIAGLEVPNTILFVNAGFQGVLALGMHLMVFEDMSSELRETNVSLASAQRKLQALAITDPLTRCYNRRFFEEVVGHELEQHRRMNVPLSVMFIDCDRFKTVNDTLGHDTGDEVLRLIGNLLRNSVRQADYVFRWGGDEFLVLLTCDERQAMAKAEEIRAAFRAHPMMQMLPAGVDLSIGCVEVPAEARDLIPVIQQADERMYAQKRRTA